MAKRILSASVGIVILIAILLFNDTYPFVVNASVAVICTLSVYEILGAMGISDKYHIVTVSVLFSIAMPLYGLGFTWLLLWYVFTIFMFCFMIFKRQDFDIKSMATIYSMTCLVSISLSFIIFARDDFGVYGVIFMLVLPWMTDIGAFFVGKFFGKNKLCPNISPNKTIEGAFGGIVVSILFMILFCLIWQYTSIDQVVEVNYIFIIIMSFIGAVISIIGDLCFSLVKRGCHIKDFGNVMPGHGGILDRFDSVIFVAPFVYLFMKLFPVINIS